MINIFLAFVILTVAMYLAFKVLDVTNTRFNLLPKPDMIRPQTKTEIAVETSINGLAQAGDLGEFPSLNVHSTVNPGEVDPEAIYSEVVTSAEGLAEGVQALAESAGETLTILIEGLSHP
jgi:hypothetical protein